MKNKCIINRTVDLGINWKDDAIYKLINIASKVSKIPIEYIEISFIDDLEMQGFNLQYRGINKATNVLSFPQEKRPIFGDILIAIPYTIHEADKLGVSVTDHLSHLIVHGFLHLGGHDHSNDQNAEVMEQLEITILDQINISNPYQE